MADLHVLKKITRPTLPPIILHRSSLISVLKGAVSDDADTHPSGASSYKLILLCSPAGYGKTTLLADFEAHTSIACCWCFLDASDTDGVKVLELLLASIRQRFPTFGETFAASLAQAKSSEGSDAESIEPLVEAFAAAIAVEIAQPFTLLLCDYHEVNRYQEINDLVSLLIQHLPAQCNLIIESRARPKLEIASLLAKREMFGLGSNELRFTSQEIYELAQKLGIGSITNAEAEQITKIFDGWITGILLGSRLGEPSTLRLSDSNGPSWGAPAIRMDQQHLSAYLAKEVFAYEPEAHELLQKVSIVQQMTPALCNALLGITDATERLNYLERQGLFVTRGSHDENVVYVCHPIVREMLYDELRTRDPAQLSALHLQAVSFFTKAQNFEQAIHHALSAQAYDLAAELIDIVYKQMFVQGYSPALAQWIDAIPKEFSLHHPRLLLARANVFISIGEYTQALPLLDAIETQLEQFQNEKPLLMAETLITRGAIAFQRGDYSECYELCQQALSLLPEGEKVLYTEAYLRMGNCACLQGNVTGGIVMLRQALQVCGGEVASRQTARLHSALANAYALEGRHGLSSHHRSHAIRCYESIHDQRSKIENVISAGVLKLRQGALAEAEELLVQALEASRGDTRYRRGEAYALVTLGEVRLDEENYQAALPFLEDGLTIARQLEDGYLINYALCILATTYLLMGALETARMLISLVDQELTGYSSALYKMTLGTIFLHQKRSNKAYHYLSEAEKAFQATGIRRELLQAMLRLASCLFFQNKMPEAIQRVQAAIYLARQYAYHSLCLLELRRCPKFLQALQAAPEAAHLHVFLQEDAAITDDAQAPVMPQTMIQTMLPATTLFVSLSSSPTIRILALGEPEVYLNNARVKRWRMAHAMELFFFLLDRGQPVPKEQIISTLWPDADGQVEQTLRSTIYYLRKVLGAACITSSNGSYTLDLTAVYGEESIWYDVAAFQECYTSAQAALAAGDEGVAYTTFEEMTRLYRGDYVQSFYSNWCMPRRYTLQHAYMDALYQIALMAYRQHRFDESIARWQHLLTIDNCLEEAHYWLIRCYLQQGKRGMALRQYQNCVIKLREELGIAPGSSLQRLYQRITQES